MQAPGYIQLPVAINDWDARVLEEFRANPLVKSMPGAIDGVASLEQLEEIEKLIPREWLSPAATGSKEACAARLLEELDNGADEICIHSSTPSEFAPILDVYQTLKNHQPASHG